MSKLLKQYQTIKTPLFKEWDGNQFERIEKHIFFMIHSNLKYNVNIEHGGNGQSVAYLRPEQMGDLFGLPYTSSSDFAAVWNTNTQTVARYGERLYFRGVALSEKNETVLVFHDINEVYYYFYNYDFIRYQEHEKTRQGAKDWGEVVKKSNIIKNKCVEYLTELQGKPYGAKTAEKVRNYIYNLGQGLGVSAWLGSDGLEVSYNNHKKRIYFDYTDNDNKIIIPKNHNNETPPDAPEYNTVKEFDNAEALINKMKKKGAELLEIIKTFKEHAQKAGYSPKETQLTFKLDLDNIADGRITWRG